MTEDEFLERWNSEAPMYAAWGRLVAQTVSAALGPLIDPVSADVFLRIPPRPRTKGDVSFLEKAFYRKQYPNPYDDVTDKVGVRFVVLMTNQIHIVEDAVLSCDDWTSSKDKDFEKEQEQNPLKFDYAAVHYIVRPKHDIQFDGVAILAGSPCEIQIKSILQHAYSEITHDTIYKPKVTATTEMLRAAAKSMALIEATNDYFEEVSEKVAALVGQSKSLSDEMAVVYKARVGRAAQPSKAEELLLDAYEADLAAGFKAPLEAFLDENDYIADLVSNHATGKLLFRQPSILAVYWLASTKPNSTKAKWPFPPEQLRLIYVDLGRNFDS